MPGHFTHIYTARRVADWLARQKSFNPDDVGADGAALLLGGLDGIDPQRAAKVMADWPKFTNVGAIGPDLFFFCQDYSSGPLAAAPFQDDILMLAMRIYYWIDAARDLDWEPLLALIAEVDQTFAKIVRFLIKLQKIWDKFIEAWNATIGPFVNTLEKALDDLTGGILSQAGVALDELLTGLKQLAEEELLTFADIFSWFALKMRAGWDEKSFVWSDMLHYRNTNQMARNLFIEAKRQFDENHDETQFAQFQAFALGWICHVGTDVIDHCFVNEQCGGPFRTHWQRHHLVENHVDAFNYRQAGDGGSLPNDESMAATDTYPDVNQAALVFSVALDDEHPQGFERPPMLPDDPADAKKAVDVDGELPDWLANGIVRAMIATYHDGGIEPQNLGGGTFQAGSADVLAALQAMLDAADIHIDQPLSDFVAQVAPAPDFDVPQGYPLPWEVQVSYRFMISYYKLAFWGGFDLAKPRRPDVIIWPPASDFSDLASAPDFSGVTSSDPVEDVCDAILAIFDWLIKEVEAAINLIGDLIKMLASPFTYPIRYGLYQVAMAAWDMVSTTHDLLAHTGFVLPHGMRTYPDNGELMLDNEIDNGLISLGSSTDASFTQALADATDPFGNLDRDPALIDPPRNPRAAPYPYLPVRDRQIPNGTTNEFRRPWAYPDHSRRPDGSLYMTPEEVSDIRAEVVDAGTNDLLPILRAGVLPFAGTVSGPFPAGALPDALFRTGRPVHPRERSLYEIAPSPAHTDALNERLIGRTPEKDHSPLGDPIQFCGYLMGRILSKEGYPVDFNLDADRGYGYRCWDWIRGTGTDVNGRGQTFLTPRVEPEGADNGPGPTWHGAAPDATQQPLQLHYLHVARRRAHGFPAGDRLDLQEGNHAAADGKKAARGRKP
jgi:hypothetical protein